MTDAKVALHRPNKERLSVPPLITYLILFFSAAAIITICSRSSPLYPFNDWDDPNCFFTVGKAMAHGQVLYRDIFEQKGPILYFAHMLTYWISQTTFFGVYLLEVAACFAFLVIAYRTIRLFVQKYALILVFPTAALIYSSIAFCFGNSAEELCLPFIGYALFVAIDSVKKNQPVSVLRSVLCGIGAGVLLWVKFTMLGFFVGFGLAFIILYLRQKRFLRLLVCTLSIFLGIAITSVPVILYFYQNNAFSYLWEVYFYDNIFLYSTGQQMFFLVAWIWNLFHGLLAFAVYNPFTAIACVFALIDLRKREARRTSFVISVIMITTFFFTFVGGRFYPYYTFVMSVFMPVGMVPIYYRIQARAKRKNASEKLLRRAPRLTCILSLAAVLVLCRNTFMIFVPQDAMPQFRFNKIISKVDNPTLLNYGFLDGGFYTVSGIVPNCRFFCKLNINYAELDRVQNEYAEQGLVDFIVTKDQTIDFPQYQLVDDCEFLYWVTISHYYLYQKIP